MACTTHFYVLLLLFLGWGRVVHKMSEHQLGCRFSSACCKTLFISRLGAFFPVVLDPLPPPLFQVKLHEFCGARRTQDKRGGNSEQPSGTSSITHFNLLNLLLVSARSLPVTVLFLAGVEWSGDSFGRITFLMGKRHLYDTGH